MNKKRQVKYYLSILNINSIDQLEENDLDYWHQKRFIEIQRSSSDKELVSRQLIELNTAKDYLDEIEYETLKKEFTNCSQFISDDYLFDIELFILSEKINLNRKEIKVYSLNSPLGSNINLFSDSIKMLKNLIQIKKYYRVQS